MGLKWGGERQTSQLALSIPELVRNNKKKVLGFLGITAIATLGVNLLLNSPDVYAMLNLPLYPPSGNLIDKMVVGAGGLLASLGLGAVATTTILGMSNRKK